MYKKCRNSIHTKVINHTWIKYLEKGGFVSEVVSEAQWNLWEEFCYDNAKANLAHIVTTRLKHIIGCAINAGPVSTPERRGIIERFFGVLEENGYHRLVNTTGSHSKDTSYHRQ